MTEQPSEAQKIAMLKCCLNPCLLESVSNVLLLWNAEKYDQAVQIALSIKANLYAHKTPSSTSCPLYPTSGHSAAECKQIKQIKDGTQTPSKANTDQHHNGNNYRSSSSSSLSSGHPPSNNKHTCRKCSAPWHPGHQCKPHQPAALNSSQAQTSSSQQLASAPSPPSSPSPSAALPPFGTNQLSTNALDVTTKQEFMKAVRHAWETQGNIELAAINLNALLHSGNTSDSAVDAPSSVDTPEAIHVEGLDTDDNDNIEDDCKDKVEPPITASILSNTPLNVPQVLQNAKTLAPKPKINDIKLDDSQHSALSCTFNNFVKDLLSKMVPPPNECQQILEQLHSIDHEGAESLLHKVLKEGYFWPNICNDCHNTAL